MKRFENGQLVPTGVYVSLRSLDLRLIGGDQGTLVGREGATYFRLPIIMAVLLAPVIGGVFAVGFPVVIFLTLGGAAARALRSVVHPVLAGTATSSGLYMGLDHWVVRVVGANGECLDGEPGTRYIRIPTSLVVLASPLLGALYVIAFPFIMAGAMVLLLVRIIGKPLTSVWDRYATLTHHRWEPAMSYLQKAQEKKEEGPTELDPELAELEKEVEERRDAELTSEQDKEENSK